MTIKLVFFASPDITLPSFERLIEAPEFEVMALVTQLPKPAKRGKKLLVSNVKQCAIAHNIEVLEPEKLSKDPSTLEKLRSMDVDFFVTFAYGQILSQEVLDIPKFSTINLHASLLPKYRGANPICAALLSGDLFTGITTMVTVLELDAGDICLQERIELDDETDFPALSREIAQKSPDLIVKTLTGLYNKTLKPAPQDSSCVTYTKKLQKEDKKLSFENSANALHNKVRAMCEVNTCHFIFNEKIVKVLKTEFLKNNISNSFKGLDVKNLKAGEIIEVSKQGIAVKCADGVLIIKTVKPEGKPEMPAYAWSLGSKIKCGDMIGC